MGHPGSIQWGEADASALPDPQSLDTTAEAQPELSC